jgi:septal ring factor EnvC (AmiA/AmiB activator)
MNTALVRQYLKQFVRNNAKQKFRIDETITQYKKNEDQLKENIIDLKDLISDMESKGKDAAQIEILKKNRENKEKIRVQILSIIDQLKETRSSIIENIQSQLNELTELEIENSGFIAHFITTDYQSSFDEESGVLVFKNPGHAEAHISTYRNSWSDSSQLRMIFK